MTKINGGTLVIDSKRYVLDYVEYDVWDVGQTITIYSKPNLAGNAGAAKAKAHLTLPGNIQADLILTKTFGPTKYQYSIDHIVGDFG